MNQQPPELITRKKLYVFIITGVKQAQLLYQTYCYFGPEAN